MSYGIHNTLDTKFEDKHNYFLNENMGYMLMNALPKFHFHSFL